MKSLLFLILFISSPNLWALDYEDFCSNIKIKKGQELSLTSIEKTLICGDSSIEEWSNIPLNQARHHLEIVLQNKGYHFPEITKKDEYLFLDLKNITKINQIELINFPQPLAKLKYREVLDEPMTPGSLNKIEAWAAFNLDLLGYACPVLTTKAFPEINKIIIIASNLGTPTITSIKRQEVDKLKYRVPERFYTLFPGDKYNGKKLMLTNQRILDSGIFQGSYFQKNKCSPDTVQLDHKIIDGPPRLIKIGLGINTESLFTARFFWSNARFNSLGSKLTAEITASKFEKELIISSYWYLKPSEPEFLELTGRAKEENDNPFDSTEYELFGGIGSSWELDNHRLESKIGLSYEEISTTSNLGPSKTATISLSTETSFISNDFELNKRNPFKGYFLRLRTKTNDASVASNFSANQVSLAGTYLIPLDNYSPPKYVLGIRGSLLSTLVDEKFVQQNELPINYRYFLGGSQNIRGFSRKSLPNSTGALTAAYLGLEQRFLDILPYKIEPLIFTDYAKFGVDSFKLNSDDFFAYGLGLRWQSPVGVFRFTAAKGVVSNEALDNQREIQLYLSFGEEF